MNLSRDLHTVTDLRRRAAQLLDQLNDEQCPLLLLQSGRPRTVLMDVANCRKLRDSAAMMILMSQGEEDVREGRWSTQRTMFARLERKLKRLIRTS